jgi:hypothetical protein
VTVPPYAAQIQQALAEFLIEHPAGDGSGNVVGPASSVNNHLVAFSGTTGKLVKDGGVIPTSVPASTGANKVLFDDGETQDWSDEPILAGLTFGTEHPFGLQASETLPDRLIIGTPSETGVSYTLTPAAPTAEGSNGSGVQLVGGAGSGGGNVRLVGGTDTSPEGDSLPANVWLIGGYADESDARGNVIVESPYLNFGTTAGETGYGLRDNDGTIEAKHDDGAWAVIGNVIGPTTPTDGHLAVFDGTTGRRLKDGGALGITAVLDLGELGTLTIVNGIITATTIAEVP